MSLMCSLIGEYSRQFGVSVVHLDDANADSLCCHLAFSVMVITNVTLLMNIAERAFEQHRRFLIVASTGGLIRSPPFHALFAERETKLGFTRWLWPTPPDPHVQPSRLFLCLSTFLTENATANAPLDFVNCDHRHHLSADSLQHIE
jgi:hypothetical protein